MDKVGLPADNVLMYITSGGPPWNRHLRIAAWNVLLEISKFRVQFVVESYFPFTGRCAACVAVLFGVKVVKTASPMRQRGSFRALASASGALTP